MYAKPKHFKDEATINFFVNLKEEDITKSFIIENFGEFAGKQKYRPYDYIDIPAKSYGPEGKKNKNKFTTTVGIFIFNKYFIEKDLHHVIGYVNKEVNGGTVGDLNKQISYAIMEDEIDIEVLKRYSMKMQHFMRFVSVLSSNYTIKMLGVADHVAPLKKKLVKQYEKEIAAGDEVIAEKIENELLAKAQEYLEGDPSMEIYDSKSRGKWGVNFKSMFMMKGAIMNTDPEKGFDVATSNYIDGISKDEYAVFANSMPGGAYAKAKNTEVGGYLVKQLLAAYQHIVLLPKGSDCKTTRHIKVKLTKDNLDDLMYSFIIEGNRLVELTSKNKSKYLGKEIKIRFSSMCESKDGICHKCMGNGYYRLGITNAGMTATKPASQIMQWSLKKFHDSSIRIADIDVGKAFGIK